MQSLATTHTTKATTVIHWLNQIHHLWETKTPFVIATIWTINGSSPDSVGVRLVVSNSTCYGRLQSSSRQAQIVKQCRILLADSDRCWIEKEYSLGDVANTPNGHCSVVFEKFIATSPTPDWLKLLRISIRDGVPAVLANHIHCQNNNVSSSYELVDNAAEYFKEMKNQARVTIHSNNSKTLLQLIKEPNKLIAVVGDSPVTQSLVQQLLLLPVQIKWLTQTANCSVQAPQLQHITLSDNAFDSLGAETRVAIATNDHELDIHCCHLALLNPNIFYVGCLGSQKKAGIVRARLIELGINNSRLSALTMPIGLQAIVGKQPSIIAASIVAQLLSES